MFFDKDEVLSKVASIIYDIVGKSSLIPITGETSLITDLGFTSLDYIILFVELEDSFNITIETKNFFTDIESILQYIELCINNMSEE